MPAKPPNTVETQLISYVIASAEMRYAEVSERDVYLRDEPRLGLVIRGEVSGCGRDCHANLAQVFLEYGMTCEGCQEPGVIEESVDRFGGRLGSLLIDALKPESSEVPIADQLIDALGIILNSMDAAFEIERTPEHLRFTMADCPIHNTAHKTGLNHEIAMAHRGFVALCESILQSLSLDWQLVKLSERETTDPLHEIMIAW